MSNRLKVIGGITAGVLVLLLLILIPFRSGKVDSLSHRDWAKIKESGRLRVVTDRSSLGFQLKDNQVEGFNYEIVKAFADSMGLELEVNIMNDLDSALYGLWEYRFDLIAMNIPVTSRMKDNVYFTIPIVTSRQMLIQHSGRNDSAETTLISAHRQLKDIEIAIPKNSPHKLRLENLSDEIAEPLKTRELPGVTTQELVQAVSEGKVPYTLCDELQARKLQNEYPNFDFSMPVGFNQHYAWAMSKKSMGLHDVLNKFLKDFLTTNAYWDIYRKYY